jgi:plasmid stabilization system protein ParE
MRGIVFSQAARKDRQAITTFTVERFGLEQARELRRRFEIALKKLVEFPGSGQLRPELDPPGKVFRYAVVSKAFILVYEPTPTGLRVVRILHGARHLANELLRDRGDEQ